MKIQILNSMRNLLLLWITITANFAMAQQITGSVKDESGAPINMATVCLLKAYDSSIVKLAVTNATGTYIFTGIKEGAYKIKVTFIGYQPAFSTNVTYGISDVIIPELKLSKRADILGTVTVTTTKPIVEIKADKTILNVEGTINAVGSNALELLRKSPGVLLDKDENISLSGKNGVQIYIDGRPTPLSGQELANYLKTMQSTQIEAIELITNPSAKYDAAGNAGIINIKLKRNKSLGTNGSMSAGWNIGKTSKYNTGISVNYRNKKINIYSTYSFGYTPNEQTLDISRTILDSLFDQRGSINDLRKAHNFKIGADYFIDKKSTIGIMVNGINSHGTPDNINKTFISNTLTSITDRILIADNSTSSKRTNANININYNYTHPKGTSLVINADRGSYELRNDQLQPNYYYDASGQTELSRVVYHIISPAQINIHSVKADYEQNFQKGKLGFGIKSAWIKTDNDFQRYDVYGSIEELDKERSNHFLYKESINAGYVNYNKQYKKFVIQGGLRIENTVSQGVSNGLKYNGSNYVPAISSFNRSYVNLFPSAAITFNKNPLKQWSLTYSRRIDRPAYQDLNPFEFKLDEYTFMKGNINLRPQYTNSFGVTHTYHYKLNITLNYSRVNDLFTTIIDTAEKSKAFVSKKNLATQDIGSINVSYPFQFKSYSLFANINSNYSRYKADFGSDRKINLGALGFNLFVQNSLKFAKTWTAEVSGFYNAPTIYDGNLKGQSIYTMDAGLSKLILKGKGMLKASLSDVFYSMRFYATSDFAGQFTKINYRGESRLLKLNFNYRFGNSSVKAAGQRISGAEEEAKRVQQGSGVIKTN